MRRVESLLASLKQGKIKGDGVPPQALLIAADRLANAAMWLSVQQTYAKHVYLDGRPLKPNDFKVDPQGHLGGALNMVPAYVGYLLANALTGFTRGWVMEQGHAVAAIDSTNLLVGNLTEPHAARYDFSEKGLTRFSRDFYSYKLNAQGRQDSPLGSHVNPNTAGGIMEGGYLGFTGLEYVHMPLPGERLVAFLSDGAWEEQKGADWAPRWWREEDSGLVVPVMIANGRRIDQRTMMAQQGGAEWFAEYLKLQSFDPIIIDGRDPLAFAWAIIEGEWLLQANAKLARKGGGYHVRMPYIIAVAPKGAGFYSEGTNAAHNLPLKLNPHKSKTAQALFNKGAGKLYVPEAELRAAAALFQQHEHSKRVKEKHHALTNRKVSLKKVAPLETLPLVKDRKQPFKGDKVSPMDAVDDMFRRTVALNHKLRARIGNPDEMLSNRMDDTLHYADFRVTDVESGNKESLTGSVITALNEEAVAAAAFGNKGGINMIVTYEAFGEKMHGIARQEVIFARHQKERGRPPGWLSVPLVLTSNTWENGKNELSHQDPSMAECMFGECADVSRVFFPAEYNATAHLMRQLYQTKGQVWTMVMAKQPSPVLFDKKESAKLWEEGGIRLSWAGYKQAEAQVALIAVGTHQFLAVLKASARLSEKKAPHAVLYLQEPGKFRTPRDEHEAEHTVSDAVIDRLLPKRIKHLLLVTHTRPEVMVGALTRLWKGRQVEGLGFINQGGTMDVDAMLFINRCSWAHIALKAAQGIGLRPEKVLSQDELAALFGKRSPDGLIRHVR